MPDLVDSRIRGTHAGPSTGNSPGNALRAGVRRGAQLTAAEPA